MPSGIQAGCCCRVSVSGVVEADVELVWSTVRSFGDAKKWLNEVAGAVCSTELLGDQKDCCLGTLRKFSVNGNAFVEKLEALDDAEHSMRWKVISHPSNRNPFPGSYVNATTSLGLRKITMSNATLVEWHAEFNTEYEHAAAIKQHIRAIFEGGVVGLRKLMPAPEPVGPPRGPPSLLVGSSAPWQGPVQVPVSMASAAVPTLASGAVAAAAAPVQPGLASAPLSLGLSLLAVSAGGLQGASPASAEPLPVPAVAPTAAVALPGVGPVPLPVVQPGPIVGSVNAPIPAKPTLLITPAGILDVHAPAVLDDPLLKPMTSRTAAPAVLPAAAAPVVASYPLEAQRNSLGQGQFYAHLQPQVAGNPPMAPPQVPEPVSLGLSQLAHAAAHSSAPTYPRAGPTPREMMSVHNNALGFSGHNGPSCFQHVLKGNTYVLPTSSAAPHQPQEVTPAAPVRANPLDGFQQLVLGRAVPQHTQFTSMPPKLVSQPHQPVTFVSQGQSLPGQATLPAAQATHHAQGKQHVHTEAPVSNGHMPGAPPVFQGQYNGYVWNGHSVYPEQQLHVPTSNGYGLPPQQPNVPTSNGYGVPPQQAHQDVANHEKEHPPRKRQAAVGYMQHRSRSPISAAEVEPPTEAPTEAPPAESAPPAPGPAPDHSTTIAPSPFAPSAFANSAFASPFAQFEGAPSAFADSIPPPAAAGAQSDGALHVSGGAIPTKSPKAEGAGAGRTWSSSKSDGCCDSTTRTSQDGSGMKSIAEGLKEHVVRRSMDNAFAPMVPQNPAPPRVNPRTSFGSGSSPTGAYDPSSPGMTELCGGGANAVTV